MGAGGGGLPQLSGDPSYPQWPTHTRARSVARVGPGYDVHQVGGCWGGAGAHLEGQIHGATPDLVHVGQGPTVVLATAWAQLQVLRLLELELQEKPAAAVQARQLP